MALVSSRRLGIGALAVAASLLVVFWTTREWGTTPPVYDGLPLQTEPYRYLQPTPGQATTAPPTSASQTIEPSGNLSFIVNTGESPPQAEVQATPQAFDIPPSVQSLVISITPVPPVIPIPKAKQDGNVYRMTATVAGRVVGVRPGGQVTVILRGTGASGTGTVERFADGRWSRLPTTIPSGGYHAADSDTLGDFALALSPGSGLAAGVRAAIAVAALLVLIGLLLVGVRLLRR